MGKGSAPRPIPDRKGYEDNFDAIFRKKKDAKPKGQIMREMRDRRKQQGLREMRIWVNEKQYAKINSILES